MVSLFLVLLAAVPAIADRVHNHAGRDGTYHERIIGGVPATIEEFPFLVSLRHTFINNTQKEVSSRDCGGTIIAVDWVLTAAHCLNNDNSSSTVGVEVRGGSSYRERGGVVRNGTEVVLHDFPPHDIALIKVHEPWPLNEITISLARLPRQDDPIPADSLATIMGWGDIDLQETPAEILMKQEVLIKSHAYCWFSFIWKFGFFNDKQICTSFDSGEMPSYIWKGDSGSPVVANGEVVGIAIQSAALLEKVYPDLHTRVSSYIDWIEQNVGPLP